MHSRTLLSLLAAAVLAASCSITQEVQPVEAEVRQICIVVNPKVMQEEFGAAVETELASLGMEVRRLPSGSTSSDCEFVATYTANWRWDLALYLCYAELRVFQDGKQIGSAVYDSRSGGANMNKFVKASAKLHELVGLLFPKAPKP